MQLLFVFLVLSFGTAGASAPKFRVSWKRGVVERWFEWMPRSKTGAGLTSHLASVFGSSLPFASVMISNPARFPSWRHAEKIGSHLGKTPTEVLRSDLVARFETFAQLDEAVKFETAAFRALMFRLYAIEHPDRVHHETATVASRWRARVLANLISVAPNEVAAEHHTGISMIRLGHILGIRADSISKRIRSSFWFSPEEGARLAKAAGTTVEDVLAADLVWDFASLDDLRRATRAEPRPFRRMMTWLYGLKPACPIELGEAMQDAEIARPVRL